MYRLIQQQKRNLELCSIQVHAYSSVMIWRMEIESNAGCGLQAISRPLKYLQTIWFEQGISFKTNLQTGIILNLFVPAFREIIGEMSEWFKEHAWKVCILPKGIQGSNPCLSAYELLTCYLSAG